MCLAKELIMGDLKSVSAAENKFTKDYAELKIKDPQPNKKRDKQMKKVLSNLNKAKKTLTDMANHCIIRYCKNCGQEFCLRCDGGYCPKCGEKYGMS